MVHVSMSCNPAFHTTGAHYINADTTAFMQLIMSDLFKDFPKLRLIIPHGGGAVPFHWGRYRGLALQNKKHADRGDDQEQRVLRHLRLSPAGHRAADQGRADRQHPVRIGNDRRGADRSIRTPGIISTTPSAMSISVSWLSAADKKKIYEDNTMRVYPGVKKRLAKVACEVTRS